MSNMIFVTPGVPASQVVADDCKHYIEQRKEDLILIKSLREYSSYLRQKDIEKERARQAILKRNYKAKLKRWREEDAKQ